MEPKMDLRNKSTKDSTPDSSLSLVCTTYTKKHKPHIFIQFRILYGAIRNEFVI